MQKKAKFWTLCGCGLMIAVALLIFADQYIARTARHTWKLFLEDLKRGDLVAANQKCDSRTLRVTRIPGDRYLLAVSSGGNWLKWPIAPGITVKQLDDGFSYARPARRLFLVGPVPVGPAGSVWNGHLAISQGRVTFVKSQSSLVDRIFDWMTPRTGC